MLLLLVLLVALVAAGWLAYRAAAARPVVEGTLIVEGLSGEVEILRDVDAVPHIRARNESDAMFALGFVHAQERLWQMEFQRRLGQGRLAELLGPEAVASDRFFRTIGLGRASKAQWPHLSAEARRMTGAYVRGINAFIARTPARALPIEFAILRATPEPWTPEDVIVWTKVMGVLLSTNWRDELLRVRLAARVGTDGAAWLMPPYTVNGPVIVASAPATSPTAAVGGRSVPEVDPRRLASLASAALTPGVLGGVGASNSWVLSGTRTTTGQPILANDPHLSAQVPAVWFLAHLEGGRLNAIGATMPGLPGVVLGHNGRIAWGATNLMVDNQDLFIERVNANHEALFQGAWEPMRVVRETIRVKGAPDETVVVRSTRHGPLVSDVLDSPGETLALRWAALDDDDASIDAFIGINFARTWDEFARAAARAHGIVQNLVYADVAGNIGYAAPGAIPARVRGDGTVPVPGWTGEYEWAGYLSADQWPRAINPKAGFIATANNQALPDAASPFISSNWEPGYRAARIVEMIQAKSAHSVEDVMRMQGDVRSAQVPVVLPWLLRAKVTDPVAVAVVDRLKKWDGGLRGDSPDAAAYEAWVSAAAERIFADEIGASLWAEYANVPPWTSKALDRVAHAGAPPFCDDVRTSARESCEEIVGSALSDAIVAMTRRQGTDVASWRWDAVNAVTFPHRPFHAVRLLRPLFSKTVAVGGDANTVSPVMRAKDTTIVASYRQVIDLADVDRSRFVQTLGQSGHLLSRHYDDMLPRWAGSDLVPMRFSRQAVDAAAASRLTLRP